ncbi:MAG: histidine kinase [Saprospiraceae bacterium]
MLNLKNKRTNTSHPQPLVYHKTKFFNPRILGFSWVTPKSSFVLVLFLVVWFFAQKELLTSGEGGLLISFAFPFLLFTFLLFKFYFSFKAEQAKVIEDLRIKLSADLHDDVGAILSGLAMQAEILECFVAPAQKENVLHLAEMSRHAMAQMRDTVWALDARKDNWGGLIDRLHDHAAEILEPRQIAFSIKIEGINRQKNLAADIRQHLYLIGKEAITNAAKHSNADQLSILLRQKDDLLEMFIQDNGQLDENQSLKTSGLGLSNITHRAQQIGAKLSISQHNGFGISLCIRALA